MTMATMKVTTQQGKLPIQTGDRKERFQKGNKTPLIQKVKNKRKFSNQ